MKLSGSIISPTGDAPADGHEDPVRLEIISRSWGAPAQSQTIEMFFYYQMEMQS